MKYRKEIDGLRAIAILPVLLFHAGFRTFSGGFVGVDIFFVISGYLITKIILAELETSSFSLLDFYERRARRILPALLFTMFCTLPFAWYWMLPQDLKSFSQSLVASSLFSSNFLFYLTSGYFDTTSELKPLLHTWSLAIEEQYYILFPFFLILTHKIGKKYTIHFILLITTASLLAAQYGQLINHQLTFYMLPTRSFELLIGALTSIFFDSKSNKASIKSQRLFSILGLMLILYAIFVFDKNTPSPSIHTLVPIVGASLIIMFANDQTLVGKLLGSAFL